MTCGGPFLPETVLVEAKVWIDGFADAIEYHPVVDLGYDTR